MRNTARKLALAAVMAMAATLTATTGASAVRPVAPAGSHMQAGTRVVNDCGDRDAPCVTYEAPGDWRFVHSYTPYRWSRVWPASTGRLPSFVKRGPVSLPTYVVVGTLR